MAVLESFSVQQTELIAATLAEGLSQGDIVALRGELGAGKTAFVRGASRALGVTEPVRSPTFTIGHRHQGRVTVSHLDLYRFDGMSDEEWGDLEPYFDAAVVFIEWPDAGAGQLPRPTHEVTIEHLGSDRRRIRIDAMTAAEEGDARARARV
jgi:tRNA threonylcarbamoyladenosine biosynthesis protein TsaE